MRHPRCPLVPVFAFVLAVLAATASAQILSDPLTLNQGEDHREARPVVAVAGTGFVVVWENQELGIRARLFDATARPLTDDISVVDTVRLPEIPGVGPIIDRNEPAVVGLDDGGFVVFWTEEHAVLHVTFFHEWREVLERDVMGRRFSADGRPSGPVFRVHDRAAGFQTTPTAVQGSDGRLLVGWQHEPGAPGDPTATGVSVRLLDAAGGPLGSDTRVATGAASQLALEFAPRGGFLAAWRGCCDGDGSGVWIRRFDSDGVRLGPPSRVNGSTLGPQLRPAVVARPDGGFFVVWQGHYEVPQHNRIFGQMIDENGALAGPEILISEGFWTGQAAPEVVVVDGSSYLVGWVDWYLNFFAGVSVVPVGPDGVPTGDEVLLNETSVGGGWSLSIAGDQRHGTFAVWPGFQSGELGIDGRFLGGPAARIREHGAVD